MRPSYSLWQHSARITLFTRANCSLCETAKSTVGELAKKRSFDSVQIDVMASGQSQWKDLYEFDTPVVHVQRVHHTYSKPDIVTEAGKLMHRFDEKELESLLNEAEGYV